MSHPFLRPPLQPSPGRGLCLPWDPLTVRHFPGWTGRKSWGKKQRTQPRNSSPGRPFRYLFVLLFQNPHSSKITFFVLCAFDNIVKAMLASWVSCEREWTPSDCRSISRSTSTSSKLSMSSSVSSLSKMSCCAEEGEDDCAAEDDDLSSNIRSVHHCHCFNLWQFDRLFDYS